MRSACTLSSHHGRTSTALVRHAEGVHSRVGGLVSLSLQLIATHCCVFQETVCLLLLIGVSSALHPSFKIVDAGSSKSV